MRRPKRFYYLSRPKVRQSWNKYNLYNLSRLRINNKGLTNLTFFQQKWYAKALTRGYHGEHIAEGKWERMFSRRLLSVVNMHPKYMAAHDGSEQAAGRGSGRDRPPNVTKRGTVARVLHELDEGAGVAPWQREQNNDSNLSEKAWKALPEKQQSTPYMQMVYAPQERRLDIAVFRALFASSARQARQMVVHGAVKVNGVKMPYPAYQLNPGDMFQVDIEHVLFATGRKKGEGSSLLDSSAAAPQNAPIRAAADKGLDPENEADADADEDLEELHPAEVLKRLQQLNERARAMVVGPSGRAMSAKKKRAFRALIQDIKKAIGVAGQKNRAFKEAREQEHGDNVQGELEESEDSNPYADLTAQLRAISLGEAANASAATTERQDGGDGGEDAGEPSSVDDLTDEEREWLERLQAEDAANPPDANKRYHTPWEPRPYMSAFAFIPRYLEVNQNICAAVYLRHPVARQGQAEVPTPFPFAINQLAFNWYLRRR